MANDLAFLYIKLADGSFMASQEIKTGKIELTNGTILTIGSIEDQFDLDLSESDKEFLGMKDKGPKLT